MASLITTVQIWFKANFTRFDHREQIISWVMWPTWLNEKISCIDFLENISVLFDICLSRLFRILCRILFSKFYFREFFVIFYLLGWQYFGLVEWRYLDRQLLVHDLEQMQLELVKSLRAKILLKMEKSRMTPLLVKNDQFWSMTVKNGRFWTINQFS